jgi:hypothetical protein
MMQKIKGSGIYAGPFARGLNAHLSLWTYLFLSKRRAHPAVKVGDNSIYLILLYNL